MASTEWDANMLNFIFREAFLGLKKNLSMTVAMIITTSISLALVATGYLIADLTSKTKDIYISRVEVMLQLDESVSAKDMNCTSKECARLKNTLESNSGVASVTYRNKKQSYENFVTLFKESDPRLVAQTSEDAFPAALHVRLVDPTQTGPIDAVSDDPIVTGVVDQAKDLQAATKNLDALRNAAFVLAAIQAVAAICLIMNMVQITAYSRREEIKIMRMVGASRWYTQAPFVLEAVIAAVAGTIVAVVGLLTVKTTIVDQSLKSLYDSQLIARVGSGTIWLASPALLLLGIAVAVATSLLTLRRYVRT